jgi:hypothetical protein
VRRLLTLSPPNAWRARILPGYKSRVPSGIHRAGRERSGRLSLVVRVHLDVESLDRCVEHWSRLPSAAERMASLNGFHTNPEDPHYAGPYLIAPSWRVPVLLQMYRPCLHESTPEPSACRNVVSFGLRRHAMVAFDPRGCAHNVRLQSWSLRTSVERSCIREAQNLLCSDRLP